MNTYSRLLGVLGLAVALLISCPSDSRASSDSPSSPWTLGLGLERTSGYEFYVTHRMVASHDLTRAMQMGDGSAVVLSAGRSVSTHLRLRGDLRYLRYDDRYAIPPLTGTYPSQPKYPGARAGRRLAEIPSLGLGMRLDVPTGSARTGLFLECMPTAYLARWNEEFDYGGARVDEYHVTKMAGGFAVGVGARYSMFDGYQVEVSPNYMWSGKIGWAVDQNNIGNAGGLSELTLGLKIVGSL